jgi:hypothetical protein
MVELLSQLPLRPHIVRDMCIPTWQLVEALAAGTEEQENHASDRSADIDRYAAVPEGVRVLEESLPVPACPREAAPAPRQLSPKRSTKAGDSLQRDDGVTIDD